MSWVLFCQIEVILLTLCLIVSFVISMQQTAKDNSFFKRLGAVSKALADGLTTMMKNLPKRENADDK